MNPAANGSHVVTLDLTAITTSTGRWPLTVRQSQTVAVSTGDVDDLGDAQVFDEPGSQGGCFRGATS